MLYYHPQEEHEIRAGKKQGLLDSFDVLLLLLIWLAYTCICCVMHLIPANVVKEHGLTFCESIKYKDEVVHGVRERSYGMIKFNGWGTIRRSNMLKENDIVHCEMLHIRKKVHSIKIRITHG